MANVIARIGQDDEKDKDKVRTPYDNSFVTKLFDGRASEVPGDLERDIGNPISSIKELAGTVTKGASQAYRLGETTSNVIRNLAKPVTGGLGVTARAGGALLNSAGEFYRGARGITGEEATKAQARYEGRSISPISNAEAAPENNLTNKVVQRPAATSRKPTAQRAAPAPQWAAGEAITEVGSGIFATGQGQPTHRRWGINDGGVISNLTLPIGQDPNTMKPEEYRSLIERETPADDVSVIRGLREFQGGREVEDSMTGQRRMADEIATSLRKYQESIQSLGNTATPADRQAISGIIQQLSASQASKTVADTSAKSAEFVASLKSKSGVKASDSKKITSMTFSMPDPSNPLQRVTRELPVVVDLSANTFSVNNGNFTFFFDDKGRWVPPKDASDEELAVMYKQWLDMSPVFGDSEEED